MTLARLIVCTLGLALNAVGFMLACLDGSTALALVAVGVGAALLALILA